MRHVTMRVIAAEGSSRMPFKDAGFSDCTAATPRKRINGGRVVKILAIHIQTIRFKVAHHSPYGVEEILHVYAIENRLAILLFGASQVIKWTRIHDHFGAKFVAFVANTGKLGLAA